MSALALEALLPPVGLSGMLGELLAEFSVQCQAASAPILLGPPNVSSMRSHIDAHVTGAAEGDVPQAWIEGDGRTRCLVHGFSVSERCGIHPTCRPLPGRLPPMRGTP